MGHRPALGVRLQVALGDVGGVGGAVALVFVIDARRRPGFIGIGTRVSAISCLEVSSRQTSGRSGSCGRV